MGKTLGINDDYWHFIGPFIVLTGFIPPNFIFVKNLLLAFVNTLIVIFILTVFQFVNEWRQATDPSVFAKYSDGWDGFVKNTKRDTKLFIIGLFSGLFMGFVIYGVLINFGGLK